MCIRDSDIISDVYIDHFSWSFFSHFFDLFLGTIQLFLSSYLGCMSAMGTKISENSFFIVINRPNLSENGNLTFASEKTRNFCDPPLLNCIFEFCGQY